MSIDNILPFTMPDAEKTWCSLEAAVALAHANQALHDAWPFMDTNIWATAIEAVHDQLNRFGLPPDLRPAAAETVWKSKYGSQKT